MNWRYHTPLYGTRLVSEVFRSPQSQDNVSRLAEQAMDTLRKSFQELHDNASINQSLLLSYSLTGYAETYSDGAADYLMLKAQILSEKVRRLELLFDQLNSKMRSLPACTIDLYVMSDFKVYYVPGKDLSGQIRSLLQQIYDQCTYKLSLTLGIDFKDFHSALSYLYANKPQSYERAADQYFSQLQLRRDLESAQQASEQYKQQVVDLQARLQNQFKLHDNYVRKQETREEGANRQMIRRIYELEDKLAACAGFEEQIKLRQADAAVGLQTSPALCLEFAHDFLQQSKRSAGAAPASSRFQVSKRGIAETDSGTKILEPDALQSDETSYIGQCEVAYIRQLVGQLRDNVGKEILKCKADVQLVREQARAELYYTLEYVYLTAGKLHSAHEYRYYALEYQQRAESTAQRAHLSSALQYFYRSAKADVAGLKDALCLLRRELTYDALTSADSAVQALFERLAAYVHGLKADNYQINIRLQYLHNEVVQRRRQLYTVQALFYGQATTAEEPHFSSDLSDFALSPDDLLPNVGEFLADLRQFAEIPQQTAFKEFAAAVKTRIAATRALEERYADIGARIRSRGAAADDIYVDVERIVLFQDAVCAAGGDADPYTALRNLQQAKEYHRQARCSCEQMQLAFDTFLHCSDAAERGNLSKTAHIGYFDGADNMENTGKAADTADERYTVDMANVTHSASFPDGLDTADTTHKADMEAAGAVADTSGQHGSARQSAHYQAEGNDFYVSEQEVLLHFETYHCSTAADVFAYLAAAQRRRLAPLRAALDRIAAVQCGEAVTTDLQYFASQVAAERNNLRTIEYVCGCAAASCPEQIRSMLAGSAAMEAQCEALKQDICACKTQLDLAQSEIRREYSHLYAEYAQNLQQTAYISDLQNEVYKLKAELQTTGGEAYRAKNYLCEIQQQMLYVLSAAGFDASTEDISRIVSAFVLQIEELRQYTSNTNQYSATGPDAVAKIEKPSYPNLLSQLATELAYAREQRLNDFYASYQRTCCDKLILQALDGMYERISQLTYDQSYTILKAAEKLYTVYAKLADVPILLENSKLRLSAAGKDAQAERDALQGYCDAGGKMISDLRAYLSAQCARTESAEEEGGRYRALILALRAQISALREQMLPLKEQMLMLKEQILKLKELFPALKEQFPVLKEQFPVLKEQTPMLKEQLPALQDYLQTLQDRFQALQNYSYAKQNESHTKQAELDRANQQIKLLEAQIDQLSEAITREKKASQHEADALRSQCVIIAEQLRAAQEDSISGVALAAYFGADREALGVYIGALKAQIGALKAQIEALEAQIEAGKRALEAYVEVNRKALESQAEALAAQSKADREVLEAQIEALEAQTEKLKAQAEADKKALTDQIYALRRQLQASETAQQALSLQLERREAHNKELQKAVKYYDAEATRAEAELRRCRQAAEQQAQLYKEMALRLDESAEKTRLAEFELAGAAKTLEDRQRYAERLKKQLEDKNTEARGLCSQLSALRGERDALERRLQALQVQQAQLGDEQESAFMAEIERLKAEIEHLEAEIESLRAEAAETALLDSSHVYATSSVIYDAKSIRQLLFDIYQLEQAPHRRGALKQAVDRLAVLCFSLEFHAARRSLECSEDVELSRILRDKLAEKHLDGSFAQDEKLTLRLRDDLAASKTLI